ncbi:hypothetical protein Nepgr_025690 [Nepenthes gracilis]|uniref:Uncharacterized protein n=1 Tax=Nepenthes gracilis TaxID=150966 RepID=A0AAD3XZR1_NEPGR|nr:hypothetical protein Nepgr_025690 [Nepenthes gracilis]
MGQGPDLKPNPGQLETISIQPAAPIDAREASQRINSKKEKQPWNTQGQLPLSHLETTTLLGKPPTHCPRIIGLSSLTPLARVE